MGHDAVDNTDIKLMLDKNGHLRPCERGLILQEMLRRDQFRLMNEMSQIIIPWKKLGNTMARDLSNLIRKCRKLELLDLENNFIGCVGCIELSKALSTHPGIRTLNLAGNKVADLGAAMLSSMLLSNTTLTHLDLSGNRLEKEAMQGLGGGLRGNTTLHTLILDENYFGDEGANELSWALTINSSLHTLSIRGNDITTAGGNALSMGLAKNGGLVNLDLSDNVIASRGVVKLMDALYKNTSLAQLDLRNNQALSEDAINAVLDALDFSHRWEPINAEMRLAVAMALHPRIGEESPLFQIAHQPINPLKAAYKKAQARAHGKFKSGLQRPSSGSAERDEWSTPVLLEKKEFAMEVESGTDAAFETAMKFAATQPQFPPLACYLKEPLAPQSGLRLAIAHAINLRRRTVLFDGQVPSPDALASLPLAVKAPS